MGFIRLYFTMFRFKQFSIKQERSAMKVGTDGVLLGAWCNVDDARRVLDIGTGTGLLSLMVSQRNPDVTVDAVEIDPEAADEARENVCASKFRDAIKVFNMSIQDFTRDKIYPQQTKYELNTPQHS